jgi:hypothetical protein
MAKSLLFPGLEDYIIVTNGVKPLSRFYQNKKTIPPLLSPEYVRYAHEQQLTPQ